MFKKLALAIAAVLLINSPTSASAFERVLYPYYYNRQAVVDSYYETVLTVYEVPTIRYVSPLVYVGFLGKNLVKFNAKCIKAMVVGY